MRKKTNSIAIVLLLISVLFVSGCGDPEKVSRIDPPAANTTDSDTGSDSSQAAAAEAEEAVDESSLQPENAHEIVPTPTPEPELIDGTIHSPLVQTGLVYITEGRAFCPYYYADESGDAFSAMLNTCAEKLGEGINVYSILAPTSFAVCLGEEVQASLECSDENYAIEYVNQRLAANVTPVRVLDTLIKHNGSYEYFATDHHWTQTGAYYSYREFCEAKGITPLELTDFNRIDFPGFLGLFYNYSSNNPALAENPDTIEAFVPWATNEMTVYTADGSSYQYNIVSDVSGSDSGSKYSAYLGGDCALCHIKNPSITDGSGCILIKDSFGNAFAPFLVEHYENVLVVDPRYYTGSIPQLAADLGVTDVIFLYNVDQILSSTSDEILALFP